MLNLKISTVSLPVRLAFVAATALALAGCALDDFAKDETMAPYGGSKLHPIVVANGKASVDECGDWSRNRASTLDNEMSANHGCAVQSNIAAMVANPNDLVHARRMSPTPSYSRMTAINGLASAAAAASSSSAPPSSGAAAPSN